MASTEARGGRPCVKGREGVSGLIEAPAPRSRLWSFLQAPCSHRDFPRVPCAVGEGGCLRGRLFSRFCWQLWSQDLA